MRWARTGQGLGWAGLDSAGLGRAVLGSARLPLGCAGWDPGLGKDWAGLGKGWSGQELGWFGRAKCNHLSLWLPGVVLYLGVFYFDPPTSVLWFKSTP